VQEGVMTETQKQHSRLFGGYKQDVTRGKTLHELVFEKGDVQVGRGIGNVILPRSFSTKEYLADLSCKADAVVIGTVTDKSSNLTEDGSFTFTEYKFVAEEVIKDTSTARIHANTSIIIVRASGAIRLLGHVVRATDHSEKPLAVGERYLLFLRFVPTTGAYRSFSNALLDDTFKLEGNQITQVSDQPLPLGANRPADSSPFLTEVRASSLNSSAK